MDSWQTFGFAPVKAILNRQLKTGKFPHAYLWQGPEGLGKQMLAKEFARKILVVENLNNHPDFHFLDAAEGSVDKVRDLIAALSFKPFVAGKKIAIINNAGSLNGQSANALLKTLEEPAASAIIILLAQGQVLPTIRSRCQIFNFNPFPADKMREFASSQNIPVEEALITLSFGKPSVLMELSRDKQNQTAQKESIEKFQFLRRAKRSQKLLAVAELADLEAEDLRTILSRWLFWQTAELKDRPQNFPVIRHLLEALDGIKINKNKKMILQGLLLKI